MSNAPKDTPYIYQPYGINDKDHWESGRIYAVATDSMLTTVSGLTKEEAEKIMTAIKEK